MSLVDGTWINLHLGWPKEDKNSELVHLLKINIEVNIGSTSWE